MSNEGRICPQCHYERQARDLAPDYECPRCGIIYAKYVPPKEPDPAPAGGHDKPPEGRPEAAAPSGAAPREGAVPASLSRRAWAGIYTQAKVFYYTALIAVPLYYAFLLVCYATGARVAVQLETLFGVLSLFTVGLLLNAYLFLPARHSETWGQKEFGLTVLPRDNPRGDLRWTQWFLRCLGSLVAQTFWPITAAFYFYGLHTGRNFPSLADRLSGTRQFETGAPAIPRFRYALNKALKPWAVGVIILVFMIGLPSLLMVKYGESLQNRSVARVITPEERKAQRAYRDDLKNKLTRNAEAAASQNTFRILTELERRHYLDQGSYTDDLAALVARYGAGHKNTASVLQALILDGSIRARMTPGGVEIWVLDASGDWISRELGR